MRRLILAAALFFAACATAAPTYQRATTATGPGYSEVQVENNRFFVTYRAKNSADPQTLQDYAMLRASEVALEHNKEWFWVDRRQTDAVVARGGYSGPSVGIGVGGGGGNIGGGIGLSIPLGHQSAPAPTARTATLEIRLGEGRKPDDPNAYDARALQAALRGRIAAP
jgi:hypothetical protein